jgi:hypothetical protein
MSKLTVVKGNMTDGSVVVELECRVDDNKQLYCFKPAELLKLVSGVVKATGAEELDVAVAGSFYNEKQPKQVLVFKR